MRDSTFLHWIAERLIHVYGESPNVDFVLRLREVADAVEDCTHESIDTFMSGAGRRVDVCMACDRALRHWNAEASA